MERKSREEFIALGKKHYWVPNGKDETFFDLPSSIIVSSNGCYITDIDGVRLLDSMALMAAAVLGYSNLHVIEAMKKAMDEQVTNVSGWLALTPQILLAEKLASLAPGSLNKVMYGCTGSDANETAMKIAREYFRIMGKGTKYKIISRWGSYHGALFGSGTASGYPWRRRLLEPVPPGFIHINPPYCYRCPYKLTYPDCGIWCAEELRSTIEYEDPSTVAAFIGDIVITSLGPFPPVPGYWKKIREICDEYGVLMIVDEVITGYGRLGGDYFASKKYGILPDMITCAKGLSAGYLPLSAVIVKDEIAGVFKGPNSFHHVLTMAGNPVGCCAGLAAIEESEKLNLFKRVLEKEKLVFSEFEKIKADFEIVGNINVTGLDFGIELVRDRSTKKPFADPKVNAEIFEVGKKNGVLFYALGKSPVVMMMPPLIISDDELGLIFTALRQALKSVEENF